MSNPNYGFGVNGHPGSGATQYGAGSAYGAAPGTYQPNLSYGAVPNQYGGGKEGNYANSHSMASSWSPTPSSNPSPSYTQSPSYQPPNQYYQGANGVQASGGMGYSTASPHSSSYSPQPASAQPYQGYYGAQSSSSSQASAYSGFPDMASLQGPILGQQVQNSQFSAYEHIQRQQQASQTPPHNAYPNYATQNTPNQGSPSPHGPPASYASHPAHTPSPASAPYMPPNPQSYLPANGYGQTSGGGYGGSASQYASSSPSYPASTAGAHPSHPSPGMHANQSPQAAWNAPPAAQQGSYQQGPSAASPWPPSHVSPSHASHVSPPPAHTSSPPHQPLNQGLGGQNFNPTQQGHGSMQQGYGSMQQHGSASMNANQHANEGVSSQNFNASHPAQQGHGSMQQGYGSMQQHGSASMNANQHAMNVNQGLGGQNFNPTQQGHGSMQQGYGSMQQHGSASMNANQHANEGVSSQNFNASHPAQQGHGSMQQGHGSMQQHGSASMNANQHANEGVASQNFNASHPVQQGRGSMQQGHGFVQKHAQMPNQGVRMNQPAKQGSEASEGTSPSISLPPHLPPRSLPKAPLSSSEGNVQGSRDVGSPMIPAKAKVMVFPPKVDGVPSSAMPKGALPLPPKLGGGGAAGGVKGGGAKGTASSSPNVLQSTATASSHPPSLLVPLGSGMRSASTSLARGEASTKGNESPIVSVTPESLHSDGRQVPTMNGTSIATNLKRATSGEKQKDLENSSRSPSLAPQSSTPSSQSPSPSASDIASTIASISEDAMKSPTLKDDKYSVFIASGISDLPSMLWKSKYAMMHTITVTDSPKITTMTSKLSSLRNLVFLTLKGCQISFISNSIEHLGPTLRTLDLSDNRIELVPDFVGNNFSNLSTLTLSQNSMSLLPPSLASLGSLTALDVSSNYLTSLDGGLASLPKLTSLNLASNNFVTLPQVLERMKELRRLDVSKNRMDRAIPKGIFLLPKLEGLFVSSNKLGDIPPEICLAKHLVELSWDDNRTKNVHDALYTLTKLEKLKLSRNEISEISERSSRLVCLDLLDLESNRLDLLPHQLFALPNLNERTLMIDKNPFASVPPEVRLAGLSQVYRFLAMLSEKAAWRRMKLMFVGNGNIGKTSLKRALASGQWHVPPPSSHHSSGSHHARDISPNPATSSRSRVKDAFKKAASTASGVVGGLANNLGGLASSLGSKGSDSDVGGSNSDPRLDPTEYNVATDGIDIDDWIVDLDEYPDCVPAANSEKVASQKTQSQQSSHSSQHSSQSQQKSPHQNSPSPSSNQSSNQNQALNHAIFTCYDFAGQDVYYPTHSMFVTSRSIYLVMFSLKDLEGSRVEYWLQMVQAKAGYSSPVLIVATHEDHRSVDKSSISDTLAAVKKKYSRFAFVKGIVSVSSKTGAGIHALRKMILTIALAHATMKEQVPRSYVLLESEIKKRRQSGDAESRLAESRSTESSPSSLTHASLAQHAQQTVTLEQWHQMSEKCFVKTKEASLAALRFLSDVGVVFHFRGDQEASNASMAQETTVPETNAKRALENIVILDPQWIADLLSTVISLKHNYVKDGVLEATVLPQLWKSYPPELHVSMLDLLRRFEIVLPMAQNGRYIVPSMLPRNEVKVNTPSIGSSLFSSSNDASPTSLPIERLWNDVRKWHGPMARIVGMKFCPMGFFGRFVARALHLPQMKVISYSMNTFVGEFERSKERVVVMYNEWTYEVLVWSASLQPLEAKEKAILYAVIDCIEILYESLYSSNRRTVWVVCPHCMAEGPNLKDAASPTLFELEDCLIAFTEGISHLPCFKKLKSKRHSIINLRKSSLASLRARAKTLIAQVQGSSPQGMNQNSSGQYSSGQYSSGQYSSGQNSSGQSQILSPSGQSQDSVSGRESMDSLASSTSHTSNPSNPSSITPPPSACSPSTAILDGDDLEYEFNPQDATSFFRDFTTRKDKLTSMSVFMQLDELEEEALNASANALSNASTGHPTGEEESSEDESSGQSSSSQGGGNRQSGGFGGISGGSSGGTSGGTSGGISSTTPNHQSHDPHPNTPTNDSISASASSSSSLLAEKMRLHRVKRTGVPLSKVAPDISFHSLGDLVIPYESIKHGEVIARGGFAEIYKSVYRGETVAVKQFLSSAMGDASGGPGGGMMGPGSAQGGPSVISEEFSESFRELQHESFLMSKLSHPNVVSLKALCIKPICMVLEWIPGGHLGDMLWGSKAEPLSWSARLKYGVDIASGLAYLHSLNIMHLDFRSPNLLVYDASPSAPVCIKVADFGLSTHSSGSHKGIKAFNPFWSSPEIISKSHYDLSTDIYSLGIVLWELLQNGRPFEEYRDHYPGPEIVLTSAIASDHIRPSFPPNTPQPLQHLISLCWHKDPLLRPSATDVLLQLESISFQYHQNPTSWPPPSFNPPPPDQQMP